MTAFHKLKKNVDDGVSLFLGAVLCGMAVIVFVQVVARYVFNQAFSWPEEVVRAGVVWTTFLGSYAAIVRGKQIKFDVLVHKCMPGTKLVLRVVSELLTTVFVAVVLYQGVKFTVKFAPYKLPMTGLSRAVVYGVFPLGAFLMLVQSLIDLADSVRGLVAGPAPDADKEC